MGLCRCEANSSQIKVAMRHKSGNGNPSPTAGRVQFRSQPAPLVGEDAVVGVLGGIFRYADAEGWADLHALENEVHAVGVLAYHSAEPGENVVLFAHALLGPADRDPMVAGEGFHPSLVSVGPLT